MELKIRFISAALVIMLCLSLFACVKNGVPMTVAPAGTGETEAETADDTPAVDLTECLWEFPGESRRVFRFLKNGEMTEYRAFEDVCAVASNQAVEKYKYRWEDGKLAVECLTGAMTGSVKYLELSSAADASAVYGYVPEALAALEKDDVFFHDDGNAFYMIRSDCVAADDLRQDWKKAYINDLILALENYEVDRYGSDPSLRNGAYNLYDVDVNGVPELFFTSTIHAYATTVRYFHSGSVDHHHLGRTVHFSDEPGVLEESDGNQGWFYVKIHEFNGSYFRELHSGEFGAPLLSEPRETEFYWDGELMTGEEFNEFEAQFIYRTDGSYPMSNYDDDVDLNGIIRRIVEY